MSIRTIDPHESESIKKSSSKPRKTCAISKYVSKDLKEILQLDEIEKENSKEKSQAAELRKNKKHWILHEIMRKEELEIKNFISPRPLTCEEKKIDSDPLSFLFEGCEMRKKGEFNPAGETEFQDKVEVLSKEKVDENGNSNENVLLPFERKALKSQSRINNVFKADQGKASMPKGDSQKFRSEDQVKIGNNRRTEKSFQNIRSASSVQQKTEYLDSNLKYKPTNQKPQNFSFSISQNSEARCKVPSNSYSKSPSTSQAKDPNPQKSDHAGQRKVMMNRRRSYSISSDADIRIEDIKENETYKRQNFAEYRYDPTGTPDLNDSNNSSNNIRIDGQAYMMVNEVSEDIWTGRFKNNFSSDLKSSDKKSDNLPSNEKNLQDRSMLKPSLLPDPDTEPEKIPGRSVIDLTSDDDDVYCLSPAPRNSYFPQAARNQRPSRNRRYRRNSRQRNGKIGEDRRDSSGIDQIFEHKKKKINSFKQNYNYSQDSQENNASPSFSTILSDASNDSNFTFNPYAKDAKNCMDNVGTKSARGEKQFGNSGNYLPCKRNFVIDVDLEPQKFDKIYEFSNVSNDYSQSPKSDNKSRSFSPIDLKSSQSRQIMKIPKREYKKGNTNHEPNYKQVKPNSKFSSSNRSKRY